MFHSGIMDSAKLCNCEMFIKGQKGIILTRVTSNMLSSSRQNSGGSRFGLEPLYRLTWPYTVSTVLY